MLAGDLPAPRHSAVRELRDPATGGVIDQAVVLLFAKPASSTGEDVLEFHCHGGKAVVDAVLAVLARIDGLRLAQPGEFTRRAFAHGRIDLTEAEGLADLLEAETEAQRKAALALADGSLKRQIAQWQERVLALSASAERAIDYADDGDDSLDPALRSDLAILVEELESWLDRPQLEPIKDGIRIVVAGPPNAGKSSLINAMSGIDRAIVSPLPGTTRDYLDIPMAIGGTYVLLTDTAGLRYAGDSIEAEGVERAVALIAGADILLWLGPAAEAPEHQRLVQLHPKADLGCAPAGSTALPISSKTGAGLADLLDRIAALCDNFLPKEDAIALNRRQAGLLAEAAVALREAVSASDLVIIAEELRVVRSAFDRITGRSGVEDLLDALFARFCLGK